VAVEERMKERKEERRSDRRKAARREEEEKEKREKSLSGDAGRAGLRLAVTGAMPSPAKPMKAPRK
jgi:hypothetical protein